MTIQLNLPVFFLGMIASICLGDYISYRLKSFYSGKSNARNLVEYGGGKNKADSGENSEK